MNGGLPKKFPVMKQCLKGDGNIFMKKMAGYKRLSFFMKKF